MAEEKELEYLSLQEATKYCNYTQEYLSFRARQGKLNAVKFGRNWVTTREWLEEYLRHVEKYNNQLKDKKVIAPPENLPVEEKIIEVRPRQIHPFITFVKEKLKLPALRFGFVAALVFILLIGGVIFGKDSFNPVRDFLVNTTKEISSDISNGVKNVFEGLDLYVTKISQAGDLAAKEIAEDTKAFYGAIPPLVLEFNENFDQGISRLNSKFKQLVSNALQLKKNFAEGLTIATANANAYTYIVGEAAKELKEYFSWLGRQPLRAAEKIVQGYALVNDFVQQKLEGFARGLKLAQIAPPDFPGQETPETGELFRPASLEPYLTINAETAINAPLSVKEKITAPSFALIRDELEGRMIVAGLTADREYNFPDLSGTVCLTAGNCVGLGGEVLTAGGTSNRLAKFISEQEVGDSSISDLYPEGVAMAIDEAGNVGIGTLVPRAKLEVAGDLIATGRVGIGGIEDPLHSLHVEGRIQATGDICTDLVGGRCLSTLAMGGAPAAAGIGGSGTASYLPIWTGATTLGNSIVSQSGTTLNVAGTLTMTGFQLPTNATSGYILTSDASGVGVWQPAAEDVLPSGTSGQTLRHNGTTWLADSFFYNTGSAIGIGATSTSAVLTVAGSGLFRGPLTISTSSLGQLVLKYDDDNYLNFSINGEQSKISSSKNLIINSLTGEVRLGGDVTLFDASNASVTAATFLSAAADSTVRKSGELVFRNAIPIFRFAVPSQTSSTTYTSVSRTFLPADSLDLITPAQLPGTSRVYAFLINFSDDIDTTSSSTWRVYRPSAGTEPFTFEFAGQNLASLEVGNPHLTATTTLPDNDWRLDVRVPSADKNIRIFNILLLVYDKIQ